MNKSMQITPPEGYEVDTENSTFENIVFKEKVKSTRWEDLGRITGWYINGLSQYGKASDCTTSSDNANIYATKVQCEAHLAQAKLSQIMKSVNGDWEQNVNEICWTIVFAYNDSWQVLTTDSLHFLTFKSKELAEQVLRENQDLLDQYKPLAG